MYKKSFEGAAQLLHVANSELKEKRDKLKDRLKKEPKLDGLKNLQPLQTAHDAKIKNVPKEKGPLDLQILLAGSRLLHLFSYKKKCYLSCNR